MARGIAGGVQHVLGPLAVVVTPLLAGALGFLTGSSNASNGLLMRSQVSLADMPPTTPHLASPALAEAELAQFRYCLCRIEPFRAHLRAVQDLPAAVYSSRLCGPRNARIASLIAAVLDPSMRLDQGRGPRKRVRVPPVAGARSRAAGAQYALVKPVHPFPLRRRLTMLLCRPGSFVRSHGSTA